MLLNGTSHKIQVTTGGAVASPGVDICADYADLASGVVSAAPATNQNVTTAATFDVFAGISTGQRKLKRMAVSNRHGSTSVAVTPKFTDGSIVVALFPATTLAPGESLVYQEGVGWQHFDSNGAAYVLGGAGRFLGQTVLTGGTQFTTGSQTKQIRVRMWGGGGAGGGCTSVASAAGAGAGGASGAYAEKLFSVSPSTTYTYAIGGGGTGVSGAGGNNGGNTTFTVGATTVTASGGQGGGVGGSANALTVSLGGNGVLSSNGDVNGRGEPGQPGFVVNVTGPVGIGGNGGSSHVGGGGQCTNIAGNGTNGSGFGAGGGGALTGASAARTGGGGSAGLIIVEEYS